MYNCHACDASWTKGSGDVCPKCGGEDILTDWDEAGDHNPDRTDDDMDDDE